MIYSVNIINEFGDEKQFYITAENEDKLYRRVFNTYGVAKIGVQILAVYRETPNWGYELVKSFVDEESKEDKEISKKANDLYKNASRKCEPYKSEAIKKYKYNVVDISSAEDIIPLLSEYKKVKVYWELGEKRGQHNYYAFVK